MKNLLLVLSLVITASPAFASKARLESLGENANGSYYINDGRNIFLNPAAINGYKKKLFIELGSTDTGATDKLTTQKIQGGFTNTFGDFVYGLYLGRESNRLNGAIATANLAGTAFIAPDHAFDFFFGGEASNLKYGVDVFYASAYNRAVTSTGAATTNSANVFGVKLGVDVSNFNIFTTIGITSNAKTDVNAAPTTLPNEYKGKLSLDLGATYAMDDMTYLAKFTTYSSEVITGTTAATSTTTGKTMAFGLGAGWKKEASKSVTMYSRVQFDYQKNNIDNVTGTTATNQGVETWYNLPIVLAAEAQATSWLSIRGSLSHSFIGQHTNSLSKDSYDNMTAAALGFGFNFGDLTIDAVGGQSAAVGTAGSESSQETGNNGSKFGFGDNMLTRLSLTYNF